MSARTAPRSVARPPSQHAGTALHPISSSRSYRARRCVPVLLARWGGGDSDPWRQPGSARGPLPPPPRDTRNPRWRGVRTPPSPDQLEQQQQGQGQRPTKPQLRNTARRLYRNEQLRKLVEQDIEEQHRGRWGPDPNAAAAEAQEQEEEDPNAPLPVQGPLQPPSWFDMVSGNTEARRVMEWVQQQREQRRRLQEQQLDDQVGLLAVVYALVAVAIGVVGLVAAS